jgi:hypothetical protein
LGIKPNFKKTDFVNIMKHQLKVLIFFVIAKVNRYLTNLASQNIRMQNLSNSKFPTILFLPYESEDCIYLYKVFAKKCSNLENFNYEIILPSNLKHLPYEKIFIDGAPSYREKVAALLEEVQEVNIWRGAIDEYRKKCGLIEFFEDTPADKEILADIAHSIARARYYAEKYEIFVIPDLAYTFNRALHTMALQMGKKIFILNPSGQMLNASEHSRLPVDYLTISEIQLMLGELDEKQRSQIDLAANAFLEDRLRGSNSRDIDTRFSFTKKSTNVNKVKKRILFLHCIRDASWEGYHSREDIDYIKTDFFVWTENIFKEISKNQKDWKIKIHPSSHRYPGEHEIIANLATKYRLNDELFTQVPDTRTILEEQLPIYTYSGTIAFESFSVGYKSFISSGFFPSWLGEVPDENFFDLNHWKPTVPTQEEISVVRATLMLMSRHALPLKDIVPEIPVLPEKDRFRIILSQSRVMIHILQSVCKSDHKRAVKLNVQNFLSEISDIECINPERINQFLRGKFH